MNKTQQHIKQLKQQNKQLKKRIILLEQQMKQKIVKQQENVMGQIKTISQLNMMNMNNDDNDDDNNDSSTEISQEISIDHSIINNKNKHPKNPNNNMTTNPITKQFKNKQQSFYHKLQQFITNFQKQQSTINQLSLALDLKQQQVFQTTILLKQYNSFVEEIELVMKKIIEQNNKQLMIGKDSKEKRLVGGEQKGQKQMKYQKNTKIRYQNNNKKRKQDQYKNNNKQQQNPQQKQTNQNKIEQLKYGINQRKNNFQSMLDEIDHKLIKQMKNNSIKIQAKMMLDCFKKDVIVVKELVLPIEREESKYVKKHIVRTVSRSRSKKSKNQ